MKKSLTILLTSIIINCLYAVDNDVILQEKFPKKLSSFLFFQDNNAQVPSEGVIPYELISALFSDYSYKQRWVYVPQGKKANFVFRDAQHLRKKQFLYIKGASLMATMAFMGFTGGEIAATASSFNSLPRPVAIRNAKLPPSEKPAISRF